MIINYVKINILIQHTNVNREYQFKSDSFNTN